MGEAAYNEAKAKGELIEQRLRRYAGDVIPQHTLDCDARIDELHVPAKDDHERQEMCNCHYGLMRDAADIIEWLSKERDRMIDELAEQGSRLHNALEALNWIGDAHIDDVTDIMDYARKAAQQSVVEGTGT